MASLQVRELPDQIYNKLIRTAKNEHRSIAQQAIYLLGNALDISKNIKEKRQCIINEIKERSVELKKFNLSNPTEMLKEDRRR